MATAKNRTGYRSLTEDVTVIPNASIKLGEPRRSLTGSRISVVAITVLVRNGRGRDTSYLMPPHRSRRAALAHRALILSCGRQRAFFRPGMYVPVLFWSLTHPFERNGHVVFPALCPGHGLLVRVPLDESPSLPSLLPAPVQVYGRRSSPIQLRNAYLFRNRRSAGSNCR